MKVAKGTIVQVVATSALTCLLASGLVAWLHDGGVPGLAVRDTSEPESPARADQLLAEQAEESARALTMDMTLLIDDEASKEVFDGQQLLKEAGIASVLSVNGGTQAILVCPRDYPKAFRLVFTEPGIRKFMRLDERVLMVVRKSR